MITTTHDKLQVIHREKQMFSCEHKPESGALTF